MTTKYKRNFQFFDSLSTVNRQLSTALPAREVEGSKIIPVAPELI